MPVHNGASFVGEAVRSVLRQTFTDFELIVIDDGSTDETQEVLAGVEDSRMRIESCENNAGLPTRLNEGIDLASADYIARMDADDVSRPDRFELQTRFLDAHPEISLVGGQIALFEWDPRRSQQRFTTPLLPHHIRWSLYFGNAIGHVTVMARRAFFETTEGYDPTLRAAQDFDLWLRGNHDHLYASLDSVLVDVRERPTGVSRANPQMRISNVLRSMERGLAHVLGQDIDGRIPRLLLDPRLAREDGMPARETVKVIEDLTTRVHAMADVPPHESSIIQRDAAYRASQIILYTARRSVSEARQILRSSPLVTSSQLISSTIEALGRKVRSAGS